MDATDYTVSRHAFARGLRYVELEVRQDWLETRASEVADLLAEDMQVAMRSANVVRLYRGFRWLA